MWEWEKKHRTRYRRGIAAVFAWSMVRNKLIPRGHPAVNLHNPAPVWRQLAIAWRLLDLRPSNWQRVLIFASCALPWVLIWFGIASFLVVMVLAPLAREVRERTLHTPAISLEAVTK